MMGKEVLLVKCKENTYCKFCKAEGKTKVKCVWKTKYPPRYRLRNYYKHYACEEHKSLIEDTDPNGFMEKWDKESNKEGNKDFPIDKKRDDHYTEADYQTWMRL